MNVGYCNNGIEDTKMLCNLRVIGNLPHTLAFGGAIHSVMLLQDLLGNSP